MFPGYEGENERESPRLKDPFPMYEWIDPSPGVRSGNHLKYFKPPNDWIDLGSLHSERKWN